MKLAVKLATITKELQDLNLKKTGENKSANRTFYYYELADFLPHLNNLCNKQKIYNQIWFTERYAYLRIYDGETGEVLTYTSPMREAKLHSAQPIQNLGAEQTYQRRYLLMAAYGICEHDLVDAESQADKTEKSKTYASPKGLTIEDGKKTFSESKEPLATSEQLKKIGQHASDAKLKKADLVKMSEKMFGKKDAKQLTVDEAMKMDAKIIKMIEEEEVVNE